MNKKIIVALILTSILCTGCTKEVETDYSNEAYQAIIESTYFTDKEVIVTSTTTGDVIEHLTGKLYARVNEDNQLVVESLNDEKWVIGLSDAVTYVIKEGSTG